MILLRLKSNGSLVESACGAQWDLFRLKSEVSPDFLNKSRIRFNEIILIVVVVTFKISSAMSAAVLTEKFLETAPLS